MFVPAEHVHDLMGHPRRPADPNESTAGRNGSFCSTTTCLHVLVCYFILLHKASNLGFVRSAPPDVTAQEQALDERTATVLVFRLAY